MNLNEQFILAAQAGETEKVEELLLEHGADIHADDNYALRWAAHYGHTKVVKLLISHYKTTQLRDFLGKKEFPQYCLQREIETRNIRTAQKAKRTEPQIEI